MKKILITGGSGLVGGYVVRDAQEKWEAFTTFYHNPFTLSGVHVLPFDLAKPDEVRQTIQNISPDVIIHCAALSDLDVCEKEPRRCYQINAEATGIIAKLCSDINCRLIFTSSDMVFDGQKGYYCESDETGPINVYGKAKLQAEEYIRTSCLNYVIVRVALVYGNPLMRGNSFSQKILNRIQNGETVVLFTDQFRTPVWVGNLSRALLELAELSFTGTVHLGGGERVDRYTFGLELAEQKRLSKKSITPCLMKDISTIAPRPVDVSFDISKARRLLKTKLLGYREGLCRM